VTQYVRTREERFPRDPNLGTHETSEDKRITPLRLVAGLMSLGSVVAVVAAAYKLIVG